MLDRFDEVQRMRFLPEFRMLPAACITTSRFLLRFDLKMVHSNQCACRTFSVNDIVGYFIHLEWNVSLPNGDPECRIIVDHRQANTRCTRTIISDMSRRQAQPETVPSKRHTTTMNTTCLFAPDILVSGISQTSNMSAALCEFPTATNG